ncbi:MAG: baseplate wedge protein 53, partial [bacterium]
PEQIANRVYGNPEKHWIILLVNQLIDPQFNWALGPYEFDKYIKQKYASLNVSLSTTETYPTGYTVGEVVYQGSTYDKSTAEATVVAYNSGTKTLQVKFASEILANGSN